MNEEKAMYHEAMHKFIKTARLHHAAAESLISEGGCHRSQHRILMAIKKHGGASQAEMAKHLEISPAAVANTLKLMTKSGLVTREADETDTRVNRVTVTERGEAILEASRRAFDALDEAMFDGIDDADMAAFTKCLEKMQENLRKHCHAKGE